MGFYLYLVVCIVVGITSNWLIGLGLFCLGMCYAAFATLFLFDNQHITWVRNATADNPRWREFCEALSDADARQSFEVLKWLWAVFATVCFSAYFMAYT